MKITVLGGGNGAFSAAAHMTLSGHEVTLANRSYEKISFLQDDPTIEVCGGALPDGKVTIAHIEENPAVAIRDAEVILVCVPSLGHAYYAEAIASTLREEQIILLNPGHMGGALHFAHVLRQSGYQGKLNLFETHTLLYIARKEARSRIGIYKVCGNVMTASLPTGNPNFDVLLKLYPTLNLMPNILYTSLSDHNAIMHPPGMLLNAALIQRTNGDFTFYDEGTTPAVGDLIQILDDERMAVARALNVDIAAFKDSFYRQGYTTKEAYESGSMYRVVKESPPNKTIRCAPTFNTRYINEDVGFGLVPISEIGRAIGVPTPLSDAFITICGYINHTDYRTKGLSLAKLGLSGVDSPQSLLDTINQMN